MNEPAIRVEEQIISLFSEKETQVYQGLVLKKVERRLLVYPLYYKFSAEDIPENIRKCEEIGSQFGEACVFRIVEHTNYHLSAILTDCGYGLEKCGVVAEWKVSNLENVGALWMEGEREDELWWKETPDRQVRYLMVGEDRLIGIKGQELLFLPEGNLLGVRIESIVRFSMAEGISRILADIPGKEELPEQYGRMGFGRAYLYRCYYKEIYSNKWFSAERED